MKATDAKAAAPRRVQWGKVFLGGLIGSLAAGATAIDVVNNHDYGVSISPAMAAVMTLAAVGLTAIPAVAAVRGWNALRIAGTVVCLLTSAYCAANAYAARQSAQILAAEATGRAYADARQAIETARNEAEAARKEASAIAEPMPSTELQTLYADAKARRDAESDAKRGGCGNICKKAEAEMPEIMARLGQAKAKERALDRAEKAEARLAEAKQTAKAGDAEPNMIASAIAARYGLDSHDVTRNIALIMSVLGIAVTLCVACYMHDAVCLLVEGIRGGEVEEAKASVPAKPEAQPKRMPKAMTGEERIDWFISERIRHRVAGNFLTPTELYDLFQAWWMSHSPTVPVPSMRALSNRMKELGHSSIRRGGVRVYADMAIAA